MKRILSAFFLALLSMTGLCCFSACDSQTLSEENALVLIAKDGTSDYAIVYGEKAGSAETEAMKRIRSAIKDTYGLLLDAGDDWLGRGDNVKEAPPKEILIGSTNRPESAECLSGLHAKDWTIRAMGDKLVICGGSASATAEAVEYFIANYFTDDGRLLVSKTENNTYDYDYPVKSLALLGSEVPADGGDFGIIYANSAGGTVQGRAEDIHNYILEITGIDLPVEREYNTSIVRGILLGSSKLEGDTLTAKRAELTDIGYLIEDIGNYLVISGLDDVTTSNGVDVFLRTLMSRSPDDGSYTGESSLSIDGISVLDNNVFTIIDPCAPAEDNPGVIISVKGGESTGKRIDNVVDTMNQWNYHMWWLNDDNPSNYYQTTHPFVKYMQFMTATGGSLDRDLFIDPSNTEVLDDYDFSSLIKACRNVLDQGLKPWIKTGNIPVKYSAESAEMGGFGVNIYQPDDYNVYYNYIAAIAQALVDEFGMDEVRTWRWGVFTEYENRDWFVPSDDPDVCMTEYCKIYDYTSEALISVLGDDIYICAHSMTCSEGIWDELLFVEHCAKGTNYCTGETGSHISALASSFYDIAPGHPNGRTMVESINILRDRAEALGLTGLEYGIDEGRILGTANGDLCSRVVGWTYQAGYDARIIKQMLDNDIDYFATWLYTTADALHGLKTVSHHVANRFYAMTGAAITQNDVKVVSGSTSVEYDAVTAYNEEENKFYIMAYAFKDSMMYSKSAQLHLDVELPMFSGDVKVTRYLVDDDANFFDEWRADYDASGETANGGWSIDSAQISVNFDANKYEKYSLLNPARGKGTLENGSLSLDVTLKGNAVVFYVIEPLT